MSIKHEKLEPKTDFKVLFFVLRFSYDVSNVCYTTARFFLMNHYSLGGDRILKLIEGFLLSPMAYALAC